jgi:hypothetical protein
VVANGLPEWGVGADTMPHQGERRGLIRDTLGHVTGDANSGREEEGGGLN